MKGLNHPKHPTDAEVEAEANATAVTAMTAIPQAQPPSSQSQIGGTVEPGARANTPEGFVQGVPFDQDGNEDEDEDEDGKITEHARNLKKVRRLPGGDSKVTTTKRSVTTTCGNSQQSRANAKRYQAG